MRTLKTLFAALGVVALTACGTKEAPGPLEPSGPTGRIRFVNLITDATKLPVNAILENVPFGVNLAYGGTTPSSLPSPSTANYSAIYAGSRSLVLKKTADTTVTVATFPLTITASQDITVYARGGAAASAITTTITTDDNSVAVDAAQTRLRAVNMTAAAVDVFVTPANADLSIATATFANVAPGAASALYVSVAAGTYQIRTVPAGTAAGARAAAVSLTLNNVTFTGGTGRTIVVAPSSAGATPLVGVVLPDR